MEHQKLSLSLPWEHIDLEAQRQIIRVLHMPELEHLAIMPDVHAGYDLCIGGVALLRGTVSPSFVGYDIGCGMCHVNTGQSAQALQLDTVTGKERLFTALTERIPAGVGKGHTITPMPFTSASGDNNLTKKVLASSGQQLGTLGSGNHFLEVGINSQGIVGVTIHSGSRRCGYDIASYYMKKRRLMPLTSELGQAYLADMQWALNFALENRLLMLRQTLSVLGFTEGQSKKLLAHDSFINETHNHALVSDLQDELVLHRKGATPAEKGQFGVIPANQRDGVYITVGRGNHKFLCSASHGAGRKYSRQLAKTIGDENELKSLMEGIVCRTDAGVLDEAPWAYKDITQVLAAQDGVLVDVIDHFTPVVVLKG